MTSGTRTYPNAARFRLGSGDDMGSFSGLWFGLDRRMPAVLSWLAWTRAIRLRWRAAFYVGLISYLWLWLNCVSHLLLLEQIQRMRFWLLPDCLVQLVLLVLLLVHLEQARQWRLRRQRALVEAGLQPEQWVRVHQLGQRRRIIADLRR